MNPRHSNSLSDLVLFVSLLEGFSIPYFLTNGTLLGCMRNGSFIEWDEDIDIDTNEELLRPKQNSLVLALKEHGFTGRSVATRHYPKVVCQRVGMRICLGGFRNEGKYLTRAIYKYPKDLFGEPDFRGRRGKLYDKEFLIPSASEELLEWQYGEWKIPVKSQIEKEYSTGNHYIRPTLISKVRGLRYRLASNLQTKKI